MESDTIIIISLLAAALSWWLAILIKDEVQLIQQQNRDEIDRIERKERVRCLTNESYLCSSKSSKSEK